MKRTSSNASFCPTTFQGFDLVKTKKLRPANTSSFLFSFFFSGQQDGVNRVGDAPLAARRHRGTRGTRGGVACGEQLVSWLQILLPEATGQKSDDLFIHRWGRTRRAHRRDFTSATMWSTPHATSTTCPGTVTWENDDTDEHDTVQI
ncbi:hypothetical protein F2P81_024922 [Scophthalmus maximus]|uniref:Uncharacterized protein n=1 Tax=Scophthalmus maximus TaxID=52904 RepID=A0A6A4RUW2_SCOMX|nr:hypothetical protein F2P81_024922 [Scophthalmus maximus]